MEVPTEPLDKIFFNVNFAFYVMHFNALGLYRIWRKNISILLRDSNSGADADI